MSKRLQLGAQVEGGRGPVRLLALLPEPTQGTQPHGALPARAARYWEFEAQDAVAALR